MYAIEFETDIRDGMVKIPENYSKLRNAHAKIVVMIDDQQEAKETRREASIDFSTLNIEAFANIDGIDYQRQSRDEW